MIEVPITRDVFSSTDNFTEYLRRIRRRYRREMNPRNRLRVTKQQYREYFKFAFVRNPWARAYSWYDNVMRDEHHKRGYGIVGHISFEKFLRLHVGKGLIRPQTSWIKNFRGEIPLDFVGRFETLIEDFGEACRLMGIPHLKLPHEIKGSDSVYSKHYDEDSRVLVSEVYKEEIEMFGYSFHS